METERQRIATLMEQFKLLEDAGAATPAHADHARRGDLLDELQDAVGLAGRMVTDRDILNRAARLLA